ncbi:BCS1 N terminal-domain-containing protein [Whalleya microplaca]|nr:BCS1 N terminal-domain-containing protein [Whalleya microplaca]
MANPLVSAGIGAESIPNSGNESMPQSPHLVLLDYFFPGFSMFAGAIQKYLHIDLTLYIPIVLLGGAVVLVWKYASSYFWEQLEEHFMSVVDIRIDDEIYNILMGWVAAQKFARGARRFVANTNLKSRSWSLWVWDYDDDDDDEDSNGGRANKNEKALSYTPSFGTHYFWYRGRILLFQRKANREQNSFMQVSEREEISISCFGRNPWILKELLQEAREMYTRKDEQKTLIYRGAVRFGSDPSWQRCMARATRPFSTVILNEKTKKELIDDVTDYLNPVTQRWYANRGIPYRRGYLLYGPPGTGKSSLSLALAGFFKMRIYIVSLTSITNEETLASLFADLPRQCVVLLEDIDTAGLTNTREENPTPKASNKSNDMVPGQLTNGNGNDNNRIGGLSLSALLNILDGVASQEGRVLIMTTNHLENLDKALIRPGRADMIVEFGLADEGMTSSIFRAIYAHLEGDDGVQPAKERLLDADARQALADEKAKKRAAEDARIDVLAEEFAAKVPAHEFSPAELQGYLMKHKRNAQAAIDNVGDFIEQTRKDRKEKELKLAEEKRKKAEEEATKKAEKEKEEAEKAEKEKKDKQEAEKDKKDAEKDEKSAEEPKKTDADEKASGTNSSTDTVPSKIDSTETKAPTEEKLLVKTKDESGHVRHDSGYATPVSGDP